MKLERIISRWEEFKTLTPHSREPFSKRNWGSGLHSLCSFQGKMKPSLAHHLVGVFSEPGDTVFDPFSGSGTIPFEAALAGRRALAADISVMAVAVSQAKLTLPSREKAEAIVSNLKKHIGAIPASEKAIQDSSDVGFNKTIKEYYHPDTFDEILRSRDFFSQTRDLSSSEWCLVFSSMLHILHGNRPYALSRRSHPITPYAPTGDFVYKSVVKLLWDKVDRSLNIDKGFSFNEGECFLSDILEPWNEKIRNVDCIITSPPFAGSTKFYMTNWLRYWFVGWGKIEFESESKAFIEVKQKKNMDSYDVIFKQCAERLKSNGIAVFHLGSSDKSNMADQLVNRAKTSLDVLDVFNETVDHLEKHGIRDKGVTNGHQYMVCRKN